MRHGLLGSCVSEMKNILKCPVDPDLEENYRRQLLQLRKQEKDLDERIDVVEFSNNIFF